MNVIAVAGDRRAPRRLLQAELEPHVEVAQAHARAAQLVLDDLPHPRAFLHEHDRLFPQLVDRHRPVGEAVAARDGEHDLVPEERLEATPRWRRCAPTTPSSSSRRATCSMTCCVSETDSATRHGRMPPLELAEDDRQHRPARPGGGADLEPAGELALRLLAELGEELLLLREQPLRAAVEALARLGRLDAAAGAVEELPAEPLLERADLEAHRRLRDAELLRRAGEAPPLDDGAERRQLPRVH